ncbi:hypothetical protein VOLCADRAFT_78216 [Volvox carteri f. nagariensis]|uniref:Pre-mRNA-processing factor 17 n=1 Tax=Volvox carteri f. nagariensis TaxID=3068 RepID=D8UK74_VOLCA|nr:uncharacterized protein VOLCADRAFT_78216 [Volvox carteri f. nagariensis]EFJ39885.1 hypothetical protein VOLCADRAFT_78216 [Volvox carteri f. nagariensis]|eukprot:XP_002959062.1 hypothetical protein VOLCADRAFT_78216 [Volvox carteri f. nagariensis]
MDLLTQYGDDGDDLSSGPPPESPTAAEVATSRPQLNLAISAAPQVDTTGMVLYDSRARPTGEVQRLQSAGARKVMVNLPMEEMYAPVLGPAHPFQKDGLAAGYKNHFVGHVEDAHMHPYHFEREYHNFHALGYGEAPSGIGVVGRPVDEDAVEVGRDGGPSAWKRRKTTAERKAEQAARVERLSEPVDPSQPFKLLERQPWASKEREVSELTEEQKEYIAKMEAAKMEAAAGAVETKGPTTFFHGKDEKDYQGRSWVLPPRDKRKESDSCFLPKRWVHTWSGHTKGVNAIRFFPGSGHLLLSAGLDGKVKIWDVYGSGKCMRSYLGHSKGVRDVCFSNDGRRFLSTGYDKNIRLWDTETGAVIKSFNNNKVHYCVKFHPGDDRQNVFMSGCQDKKIYQFDADTGEAVQEYNYHLGPVNTVTFIDEGRQFVSTSDDKTIRVWEFGIPVQIKYIADPSMHSMPAVATHPSNNYLLMQSLDNQVLTYMIKDGRFKSQKNKTFKGHNTAGYACQVNTSPDGKYVMSGDSEGRCFFWEWGAAQKIVRTIKAHDAVCIGCAWNPMESSKVATCGWDGVIKYWD